MLEGYQKKFPTHPRLPLLLDTELISDSFDELTGVQTIVRRCKIAMEAPGFFFVSLLDG